MKSFKEYLLEAKDYFTGSQFSNEHGDSWNVEDVIEFAKSDSSYLHKNYPIDEIKNQLSWWEDNKEQRIRMKKSDTSFPILIIIEKDGTTSVADGLNRLKKAISIEKRDTIPAYVVPMKDIQHLKVKLKNDKNLKEDLRDWFSKSDPDADRSGSPINVSNYGKGKISEEILQEKNIPTSPEKWSHAKALARSKFKVYPSAYANGWAAKKYKAMGGGWETG